MSGRLPDMVTDARLLLRPGLCAMVALSALAGLALAPVAGIGTVALPLTAGTFLLAAGASVLNQLQERATDAVMQRTRRRPLASGRMRPGSALLIAGTLLTGGGSLLHHAGGAPPVLLGALALGLYNGLYTPLKRRSSLCLLPGALCGSVAPLMGWAAAEVPAVDLRIASLSAALFLWQLPHFWTLAHKHRDDLRRAGLALPPCRKGIVVIWLLAMGSLTALGLAFGLLQLTLLRPLLFAAFLWLLPPVLTVLDETCWPPLLQTRLQVFLAALLILVAVDGIVLA